MSVLVRDLQNALYKLYNTNINMLTVCIKYELMKTLERFKCIISAQPNSAVLKGMSSVSSKSQKEIS
jgi:hypothetical protein